MDLGNLFHRKGAATWKAAPAGNTTEKQEFDNCFTLNEDWCLQCLVNCSHLGKRTRGTILEIRQSLSLESTLTGLRTFLVTE